MKNENQIKKLIEDRQAEIVKSDKEKLEAKVSDLYHPVEIVAAALGVAGLVMHGLSGWINRYGPGEDLHYRFVIDTQLRGRSVHVTVMKMNLHYEAVYAVVQRTGDDWTRMVYDIEKPEQVEKMQVYATLLTTEIDPRIKFKDLYEIRP